MTSFRPNKMGKYIKIQKNICPHTPKNNVGYKISCNNYDVSYVGQTGRQLKTRITEHRNHIRHNIGLSGKFVPTNLYNLINVY